MEKVIHQAYFNLNILVRLTKKYVKKRAKRNFIAIFCANQELT